MPSREELTPATATITIAGVNIGSPVPANHRRYIYYIQAENQFAGANVLQFLRTLVVMDHIGLGVAIGDMFANPDELKEDSLPLYIAEAAEQLNAITDAGDAFLRILYVDAP